MSTYRNPPAVVKNVNNANYDSYLQKKKGNAKTTSNIMTNTTTTTLIGCKSCKNSNSFLKKVQTPSYETYLNSIKSNIVKNKYTNIGENLNCNCPTEPVATNDSTTLYYIERSIFLKNNEIALLGNSTTSNIVPFQNMVRTQ